VSRLGRIRPCLLRRATAGASGRCLADSPALANACLSAMLGPTSRRGVLIDVPGAKPPWGPADGCSSAFSPKQRACDVSGRAASVGAGDVYGLACLELG